MHIGLSNKITDSKNFIPYLSRLMAIQPNNITAAWFLNDSQGLTAIDSKGRTYQNNVITNGDHENSGGYLNLWSYRTSNGVIEDEQVIVHSGNHACKITTGAGLDTWIVKNSISVTPGPCSFTTWTRGDGVNSGRYALYNETAGSFITTLTSLNVSGTQYTEKTINFTIPVGCSLLRIYLAGPSVNGGYCYFDDTSLFYTTNMNGLYSQTGVTYNEPGIINGLSCCKFSGVGSGSVVIGGVAYNYFMNPNIGSVISWGRVSNLSVWSDSSLYRYLWHPKSVTETVYMVIGKSTTNNQLAWRRRVASTIYEKTFTFSPSGPTTWFCQGFSWDMVSNPKKFKGFVYAPFHTSFTKVFDETPSSGYGDQTWNKETYPLTNTNALLMAGGLSSQLWPGWGGPTVEWGGISLTDNEFLNAMVI